MAHPRNLHDGREPRLQAQAPRTWKPTDACRTMYQLPAGQEQSLCRGVGREPSNVGRVTPYRSWNRPRHLHDQTTTSSCDSSHLRQGADAIAYMLEHVLQQHTLEHIGPEWQGGSVGDNAHPALRGIRCDVVHMNNGLPRRRTSGFPRTDVQDETVVQTPEEGR